MIEIILELERKTKMINQKTKDNAIKFMAMHKENKMFVLPNCWNAGSAMIFERAGFDALATTSAGVAYALGYPDGEDISFVDLLDVVKQINKRINVPLSCDFERGYSDDIIEIKNNAKMLVEAGVVGFNIEDGKSDGTLDDLEFQLKKIKALVELKKELDVDFVINARTCVYWLNIGNQEEKLSEVIKRCKSFIEAGADCVFVPGAMDKTIVENLVKSINGPINIVLNPKFYDIKELETIGVKRLSLGSSAVRYACQKTIEIADELKNGNVDCLISCAFSYATANSFFEDENEKN